MSAKKRSLVHSYFKSMGEKDAYSYRCNECSALVKAKSGNTSNLRHHLQTKHKMMYESLLADEAKQCKVMVSKTCDFFVSATKRN